ncbi:MAG TPA: DUF5677 domain-containing protein [Nocardioidaceae bacterium]
MAVGARVSARARTLNPSTPTPNQSPRAWRSPGSSVSATLGAAALTRVVIEHAVLAQWLKAAPEDRAALFLQQSEVEQYRWYQVIAAAESELAGLGDALSKTGMRTKNVAEEFNTVKNLFGDAEMGTQLYLTYRNLSRFVHPAVTTFGRYSERLEFGLILKNRLSVEHDPEAVAFYLASATLMCTLPYLALLDDAQGTATLLTEAGAAGLVTSMDG